MALTPEPDVSPRRIPDLVARSAWAASVWTGAMAACLVAAIGVCVAVLCWLPDAGVSGRPLSAIRAGLLAVAAAQHGGLTVDGVPVDFVPLGMTVVVAVVAWRAGGALAEVLDLVGEQRTLRIVAVVALQTASYTACVAALVPLGTSGTTRAPLVRAAVAAALLFGASASVAVCRLTSMGDRLATRLGPTWSAGLRGSVAASLILIAAGALVVAAAIAAHAGRVTALSRLVGGGLSGLPVAVLGAFTAPNGAIAGAAYLAGPGFAVGARNTVDAFHASHGTVPAFPVLGALPTSPGSPLVFGAMALTWGVAAASAVACVRRLPAAAAVRAVCVAAAGAGLGLAVLAWAAGGAVGVERLRTVGASPWRLGVTVAVEVGTLGLVLLGGWRLGHRLRSRRAARGATADRALEPVGTSSAH